MTWSRVSTQLMLVLFLDWWGEWKRWLNIRLKLQFYLQIEAASIYEANWVTERISWVIKTLDCFYLQKAYWSVFFFLWQEREGLQVEVTESIHLLASVLLVILTSWKCVFLVLLEYGLVFSVFIVYSLEDIQILLVYYIWDFSGIQMHILGLLRWVIFSWTTLKFVVDSLSLARVSGFQSEVLSAVYSTAFFF